MHILYVLVGIWRSSCRIQINVKAFDAYVVGIDIVFGVDWCVFEWLEWNSLLFGLGCIDFESAWFLTDRWENSARVDFLFRFEASFDLSSMLTRLSISHIVSLHFWLVILIQFTNRWLLITNIVIFVINWTKLVHAISILWFLLHIESIVYGAFHSSVYSRF